MGIPSDSKNQINRSRGSTRGDEPSGFERKPMLDEHRGGGLRGDDKQQDALENSPGPVLPSQPKGDFKPPKQPAGPYDRDRGNE